jgi:hypothetical protein
MRVANALSRREEKGSHRALQISGYCLEFANRLSGRLIPLADRLFKAVIDVIVDKRCFRVADCAFDCLELLRNVDARTAFLDHCNDAFQVSLRTTKAFDDVWM